MRIVVVTTVALAAAAPVRDWTDYSFDSYQRDFGKIYNGMSEFDGKRQLFETELQTVLAQNEAYAAGLSSWHATINEFSDWTTEEFGRLTKGFSDAVGPHPAAPMLQQSVGSPDRVDWREKDVATPVKDQGSCGSCWAFGSTAVLESHYALATGDLPVLAPQAYVDCSPNPEHCGGVGGCKGSIPELAFNWSASAGMPLETDYPYTAQDGTCQSYKAAVVNSGYAKLPVNDAQALETAIATLGPMAVNVAASTWSRYGGGVYSGGCSTATGCTLNHIVAAYGYERDGEGYWLIRNSWGSSWGEDGYIRLARSNDPVTYVNTNPAAGTGCLPFPETQTVGGESGVLFDVSYPTDVRAATDAAVSV